MTKKSTYIGVLGIIDMLWIELEIMWPPSLKRKRRYSRTKIFETKKLTFKVKRRN